MRRKKLSDMLSLEEEAYRREMVITQETPEQVRLKMEQKLNKLKTEREEERQEKLKALEEKRFIKQTDELRKNESEAFAITCYIEQENQMLDKLKIRDQERKEEEFFLVMNNFDNQKKRNAFIIQFYFIF
jgi:carboxylesterase type B